MQGVSPREGTPHSYTKDALAHQWLAKCHRTEIGCLFYVSAKTEEDAQVKLALHNCPHKGGPTKVGLLVSKTLLEECWDELDEVMDIIMDGNLDPQLDAHQISRFKGEARGMAKLLANFMKIYFPTADDIAREAQRRYEARKANDTEYCTQGLGSRATEFPPGFRKEADAAAQAASPRKTTSQPRPTKSTLDDQEKQAIKFAHESGMFTREQLAKTYKVTPAEIDKILTA